MRRVEPSSRPAATSARVLATVIDGFVMAFAWGTANALALAVGVSDPASTVSRFFVAVPLLYEVSLTTLTGQTVGKRALGVVVVDDRGQRPGLMASGARYLVKTLAPLAWLWPTQTLVGLLLPLYELAVLASIVNDPVRRGWHDHVARTTVVESATRRPLTSRVRRPQGQTVIVEVPASGSARRKRRTRRV